MPARVRPFLLIAVVAAVLLGGWLLGNNLDLDPGGDAPPSQPTQAATASATPATARDLALDEALGGHTLSRHVGLSDSELRARLDRERDTTAASTFFDRPTAERAVGETLVRKGDELERWLRRTGSRPNLALRAVMPAPVGRSWRRDDPAAEDVAGVVVVLRWSGDGWYVLTSYPEHPR